jgi:hypothetical protein
LYVGAAGVVELVDDDHIERVRRNAIEIDALQRLHGCEHVLPFVGTMAVDVQLTEGAIAEDMPERDQRLLEDLLAMGDEQELQRTSAADFFAQAFVIERRDDGLARAGRGDDEIAPAVVPVTLGVELVEDLALMRPRLNGERYEHGGRGRGVRLIDGVVEATGVIGAVGLE